MSRRAVIEEVDDDEFDDDTDLLLPSLPNTGARGPILQELNVVQSPTQRPVASTPRSVPTTNASSVGETSASGDAVTVDPVTGKKTIWVQDGTPFKTWTSIYPIYIDAKKPYDNSERRIARNKSVWWPLSMDIVEACSRLRLKTLHEPTKQHPRDWENPGRVKVCFKVDGRPQNPNLKTTISEEIQKAHPDLIPRLDGSSPTIVAVPEPKPSGHSKDKAKTTAATRSAPVSTRKRKYLPQPPPGPPRISQYSPAQEANLLIETVKAGMNAPASGEGAANPALAGKGKRKVIRVRRQ
ncbi:hypothetical protein Clacol_004796 [Clathrus columnatus]|uniref:Signal recognition particle, SRP19 subunit n=1 Tax=Clathrus columnatus TaxID=1419009 RepID=A0AAV5ACY6_9AGAM|nr:hypothetical protein Clacol_004796 [Clathrus columnatus]